MLISINTEVLASVAALARSINEEINEISAIMNRVTTHDDWNCKERDGINEDIVQNRNMQKSIQNMSENFATLLTDIADRFLEAERTLPNKFQRIDAIIGTAISAVNNMKNTQPISVIPIRATLPNLSLTDSMQCYEVESFTDNINICDFNQFTG